ncbi:MAG: efflux RND transporter permease subunit [Alphaproteobacteria bacterium]|nr:efflux RND transporter permease subunit [Alphaproteobacteria bacterium]
MGLSGLSVRRPVFATVLSAVLLIFGLAAYRTLPVREYPDIDKPIVSIDTVYRGASAPVIESQVTQVLEEAVSGIEGIDTITSNSREESASVNIEFTINRDIEAAANDVRDRAGRAARALPDAAEAPSIAKTDADSQAVLWLSLTSDRMNALDLTDYAERYLVDPMSTVPGVARVRIGGARKYAMRIWLDPAALAARGLTAQDVEAAVRRQNLELPSGRVESLQRELAVRTESALTTEDEFRRIVVAEANGYLVRLSEVAEVELGPEDERSELRSNGRAAVGIGIIKQSKANTLEVATGVRAEAERLRAVLPQGTALDVTYDQSVFIRQSIDEVFVAMAISLALVVGVIFVFLRSVRATAIPTLAIPVSIIAAFSVIAVLGFSVNVLTLLAIVLAIGLVVDDAIVVLENIHRRIEEGEPPLLAAVRGARQIAFAVVATTLVLAAVFVPISFMEGSTGRLFREFGITVAAAVLFSGLVALSLTPMLCSKLLRPVGEEGPLYRASEIGFRALHDGYRWLLQRATRMPIVVLALAAAVSGVAFELYRVLPKEVAPTEDRGVIFIPVSGPEGASLEYMRRYVLAIEGQLLPLLDTGVVERVFTILAPGFGRPGQINSAFTLVRLRNWSERDVAQQALAAQLMPKLLAVPGVRAFPINPASLGQGFGNSPVQMVLGGPSYEVLAGWRDRVLARARTNERLLNVSSDYEETRPELKVEIDRDRAGDLGVSVEEIGRTLEVLLGSRFVTTFVRGGKEYNVILQAPRAMRTNQSQLAGIYVRSTASGELIPLANLVRVYEGAGARELKRVDRLRAITISASLAPGYTIGEAVAYLDAVAAAELPPEARVSYQGESREFLRSSQSLLLTFGLALLVVFLVLAAQFESFIHPLVIILVVPLAVTGALGALIWSGLTLNVYSQIGIIMLIGLITKNAILIVDFANQLRDRGLRIADAVREAAVIRLRPILMTTIATAVGAVPLALATGAGAEAREALGVVVIGGITFSTVLSLFVVPVLYVLLARFTLPTGYIARRLSALEAEHPARATAAAE